jgi:hypothetical protein
MTTEPKMTKVLGTAQYEARWVQRSFLVRLTAMGTLPCSNYSAQLEQAPDRVVPPNWQMIFYIEDFCLRETKPFTEEVLMVNDTGAKTILVTDASGEHHIPIQEANVPIPNAEALRSAADRDEYVVYAKLPRPEEGHNGCIVVPADYFVTGIQYRAFGPASKADCETFVADNCGAGDGVQKMSAGSHAPGGEIPWPLAK